MNNLLSNYQRVLPGYFCCALAAALLFSGTVCAQGNVAEKEAGREPEAQEPVSPEVDSQGSEEVVESIQSVKTAESGEVNVAESNPAKEIPGPLDPSAPVDLNLHPPAPATNPEKGGFFSDEERRELGLNTPRDSDLPGFAEGQSEFIPDITPGDLFNAGSSGRSFVFQTGLGDPKLPADPAEELIRQYNRNPDRNLDGNQARIVVPTGSITGSTETKQFKIDGGLTLYYSNVSITADSADIDEKNEVAILYGNVNIVDPKYRLKTDELRLYFEDKRFVALGFVQFKKDESATDNEPTQDLDKKDRLRESIASNQFELFCKDLYYNWDTSEMTALDSVRLVHPSFNGTMERIDYNDDSKEYEMSGKVVLNVTEYDWIFENDLVAEDDLDQVAAITDNETTISCDKLVYSEESGVAEFFALLSKTVKFDQSTRSIEAQYIEVNDQTKDFFAEGSDVKKVIYQQRDGEWLFTGGIVDREEASEDLQDVFSQPLTVTSVTFTYNFDRKRLELDGGVSMSGNNKSLEAIQLVQDETAKYFLLRGNVYLKPDLQSEIRAAQVYIDTERDVFTFVGLVEGQLESSDLSPVQVGEEEGGGEIEIQQGLFENIGGPARRSSQATDSAVSPDRQNRAER